MKSTLMETRVRSLEEMMADLIATVEDVKEYFPKFKGRKFIGSLAALDVSESMIKVASERGIVVLSVGDELMEVVNEPGFKPTIF